MKRLFNPITNKTGEIVDFLMASPDMPSDESLLFKIRLSIEEIVENIVKYAYQDGVGWMEVGTELDPQGVILQVTLKDAGKPFNPLDKPDPDINVDIEEREIGGLGIFLCKQLMDNIYYHYEDDCNILTMYKNISSN